MLSAIESLFEGIFEGGIRRLLRPRLQPVEISRALERAMVSNTTVGPGSLRVPNRFRAGINPADFRRLGPLRNAIERDAAAYLEQRALQSGLCPLGPIRVALASDSSVGVSFVRCTAEFDESTSEAEQIEQTRLLGPIRPPSLAGGFVLVAEDGRELRVGARRLSLGRAADNDFVIRDVRVSRHHATIEPHGGGWMVRDLGSTNGTFVGGRRVAQTEISAPTEISLGGCRLEPLSRAQDVARPL
ncbi:MAG TPA: FhaA domain-containing protein [Chloroflexota bacterium]|nr:FhaA domain-containing protein [Chloroflexota bacterium]